VSLRGSYWQAAFNTGNAHPLTGVGLDSFGDWYRKYRSLKAATWLPGPETITNVAHNFYLDFYANGGLPLFLSYAVLNLSGFYMCYKISRNLKRFEFLPVTLIAVFIGFFAQSIISIPQIGVAVWGWVVVGFLFSYARITNENAKTEPVKSKKNQYQDSPIGVFVFIGMAIGLLVVVPPFSAEVKYTSAVKSSQLVKIEAALAPSYFSPSSVERLIGAVTLLEQNKLYSYSHKYALMATKFNPNFYNAWKALYYVHDATQEERSLALKKMKLLDPLNRNLEKLK
jgi:hypothetical protein